MITKLFKFKLRTVPGGRFSTGEAEGRFSTGEPGWRKTASFSKCNSKKKIQMLFNNISPQFGRLIKQPPETLDPEFDFSLVIPKTS